LLYFLNYLEVFHLAPLVSIVILNWNGRKYLQQFLPFVLASTYSNFEIVVADNASSDDSVSFLQQHYPSIKIIVFKENFGFAKGYNEALKQVQADYYVLLNSDVEVSPGWMEPVVALMENDIKIGACQPKLLLYANRGQFEYSGAAGGWIDRFGYPFARGRVFDEHEMDEGQYDNTEPVFWASGAAMFVRAPVFHMLGGLDEYFFAHQEEIDFCWRLHRNGYSVYCCPQSVVYHVGGGTLPKGNSRKVFLNFRNNLVMMAKNMPAGEALWKIAYRFLLDLVSAIKSLMAGEGRYFTSVIRAHVAFLGWLFSGAHKRDRVAKGSKTLGGYYRGSIVWAHFVRGKKKFSEIVGAER
jgi:GT2 family glycosyltransferase